MKKITTILGLNSDDELFNYFISTLKVKGITQWNYFINWDKVYNNISPIEMELNLLNTLVGKDDIESHLTDLIIKYPQVVNVIPVLLAIRFKTRAEQIINIIDDVSKFTYETFDLSKSNPSKEDAMAIAKFFIKTGLGKLIQEKKVKNLVDYALGVEVGLDSNGRKNRGGHQMENAVEFYIKKLCDELGLSFIKEANAKSIEYKWGIEIDVDKSSRRVDYAINNKGQLYFFEVNFYNGGGSKLKSTATEYVSMSEYWNKQKIKFIWITDGAGWIKTQRPLREYFDKSEYLLNLEMLRNNILKKIIL